MNIKQKSKVLKSLTPILLFTAVLCLAGCVNRIDIPEDEDSMLYINLEMHVGQSSYSADFKTTNNLNGSFPIYAPQDAEIKIAELNPGAVDNNKEVFLIYDSDSERYVSDDEYNLTFLTKGRNYTLEASVEGSGLDKISAITKVPNRILIDSLVLISEAEYTDKDENHFWQGTIGIHFKPSTQSDSRYGYLHLTGKKTIKSIGSGGEIIYTEEGGDQYFDLINVVDGNASLTDVIHRTGWLIDFDKIENDYLEMQIRSPFAISDPSQVTDFLNTNMVAVGQDHYEYHIALHNIKKSEGNIFEENALYRSNIEKGLGLFSTCYAYEKEFDLR